MNPVFWLLVLLGAIAFWFFTSLIFYPLGKYLYRIWRDTIYNLTKDDKKEEENKE